MYIYFPEITFSAAHYIPGHLTCGGIHGHTYFIQELRIDVSQIPLEWDNPELDDGMSIDFGLIKTYFKEEWDHKFLVPDRHYDTWEPLLQHGPLRGIIKYNLKPLTHTTAEWMATEIRLGLKSLLEYFMDKTPYKAELDMIHFQLWEGPHQAVEV